MKKNGLITDLNALALAKGIKRLIEDEKLYQSIKKNLEQEKKEDLSSITKFDLMISELLSQE